MTTIETLKKNIIQKIQVIDNEKTLNSIENLLDSLAIGGVLYVTTDHQREAVFQGAKEINEGNYYSQEEIDKMDTEWLNEERHNFI
jgi:hypothetical protein